MDTASLGAALGLGSGDQLSENVVSFEVYPDAEDADIGALLQNLIAHLAPFLEDYVWQRGPFQLHPLPGPRPPPWAATAGRRRGSAGPAPPPSPAAPAFLWGSLDFGDNVEDEWFAVWLLLELTRAFPVTARVWDNDGEFILIEAAYSLPRWLKPETAPGRVWLRSGSVHLVPLELGREDLTPAEGLAAVRARSDVTAAVGKAIDEALAPRLEGYPARAHEMMHRSVVVVPAALAAVLAAVPQAAAVAVESFHYRDPYDARTARKMTHFPPQNMVRASLRLNRCLYAQLALQEWSQPEAWPPAPPPGHPDAAAVILGAKLAAGYEMLLEKQRKGDEEESLAGRAAAAVRAALQQGCDVAALAAVEVPPADSDAWLREAPAAMEAELRRREAEVAADEARRGRRGQQDFDPNELSARMKEFVEATAGLEGAEVPREGGGVAFSEERFLAELQRVLGAAEKGENDGDYSSSDEGSSFYGSDTEGDEEEEEEGAGGAAAARRAWAARAREEAWEAATATDSDDEGGEFMESYGAALAAQLEGTTLTQTFAAASAGGGGSGAAGASAEGLQPVDVDANLVASLLASYQEQGGLPGPASNLAGLLGVQLPDPEPEAPDETLKPPSTSK